MTTTKTTKSKITERLAAKVKPVWPKYLLLRTKLVGNWWHN